VEYLLWWVKDGPLDVPLVTTGPSSQGADGAILSASDAVVLYGAPQTPNQGGNDTQAFPAFNGGRLTLGYSLDAEQCFRIEASGFWLENQSAGYAIRSGGTPVLNIPVYNSVRYLPGGGALTKPSKGEDGLPLAIPGVLSGGVTINNALQLWGADAAAVINLGRTTSWELSGLAGLRYFDLSETFSLDADITGIGVGDEGKSFLGQSGMVSDRFETRNQFYGANLGLRGRFSTGPVSVEMSALVAAGLNHETQKVSGYYTAVNSPFGSSGPEGIFAQPANEGRTSSDRFAYVPEVQFKLGYAITPSLRATIGYDIIYESNVIRPGDQINRNLPKGQVFNQGLAAASSTSPTRQFNTTDFFAQGLSMGLEFTF
jgi:hypothetical protein